LSSILTYTTFQNILACIFGLGLVWSGINRKGVGVRGLPEVAEQSDPAPIWFSAVLIVFGLLILGHGVIHLLL
jgi:F0F1-type ATP synthase membrane subunit c/vacuolar-type H+-ATPase subunit K